jgi:ribose transport system ATP-binding protein
MSSFGKEIVKMTNISKSFPGVKALEDVDFSVREGEVHALVGENGAGKSTLIKILMGVHPQDQGEICFDGKKVSIKNPIHAKELGLGAVYQDITLVKHLSVGENFFNGKLPKKNGIVDWKKVYRDAETFCGNLGISVNPKKLVKNLTAAQQEMITIAKVMQEKAKVIIFDEPTALLANEETAELFELIRKLKGNGVGIIYISHRLEEIFEICDTVTVLKDGKYVKSMPVSGTNNDQLITLMVGRSMEDMYKTERAEIGETVLEVKNLGCEGKFEDVNFDLKKSEILGFFGLVGSGRTEVMQCIYGANKNTKGDMKLFGEPFKPKNPKDAIKKGLGLLPENRKVQGLAMQLDVKVNINMAAYEKISRGGVLNLAKEKKTAEKYVEDLQIKTPSIRQKVKNLSGGNQQKVVISRWLNKGSRVLIFDEPTVGVDVGAKGEIYKIFENLTKQGDSLIVVSSYLPEVMGIADRVIIMREGKQMGVVSRDEFNDELLLKYATALKQDHTTLTVQGEIQ